MMGIFWSPLVSMVSFPWMQHLTQGGGDQRLAAETLSSLRTGSLEQTVVRALWRWGLDGCCKDLEISVGLKGHWNKGLDVSLPAFLGSIVWSILKQMDILSGYVGIDSGDWMGVLRQPHEDQDSWALDCYSDESARTAIVPWCFGHCWFWPDPGVLKTPEKWFTPCNRECIIPSILK